MWGVISHFQTISLPGNMLQEIVVALNEDFMATVFFGSKEFSSDSSNGFPLIASQIPHESGGGRSQRTHRRELRISLTTLRAAWW